MAQVLVVAEQIGAIEQSVFRNLLGDLERRHRAHFEVAALERRHFGTLLEQGRRRVSFHGHADMRGFNFGFETLQRLREEIRRRGRGRNPNGDVGSAQGAGGEKNQNGQRHQARRCMSSQPFGLCLHEPYLSCSTAPWWLMKRYEPMVTLRRPICSISASMRSPILRNVPFGTPPPAGVPVSRRSPGSSVMISEARAICSATE